MWMAGSCTSMPIDNGVCCSHPLKRMRLSLKTQRLYSQLHRQDSANSSHSSSGASPPSLHASTSRQACKGEYCSNAVPDLGCCSSQPGRCCEPSSYSSRYDQREWKQATNQWSPPTTRMVDMAPTQYIENRPERARSVEETLNIATLRNMGNTCFLNSVLYILRYTPGFTLKINTLADSYKQILTPYNHDHRTITSESYILDKYPSSVRLVLAFQEVYCKMLQVENNHRRSEGGQYYSSASKSQYDEGSIRNHETSAKCTVRPECLLQALRCVNPMYEGSTQHDAHELLGCVISVLDQATQHAKELNKLGGPGTRTNKEAPNRTGRRLTRASSARKRAGGGRGLDSQTDSSGERNSCDRTGDCKDLNEGEVESIGRMFTGQVFIHTRCRECEHIVQSEQDFIDISVPVDGPNGSLIQSLQLRTQLNGDNKYWCSSCQHENEADRSSHFLSLPPVITVQLQRFGSSGGEDGGIIKLSNHIPIPLYLPCFADGCRKPCFDPAHKHVLFGIVFHMGMSVTSGHYTALIRSNSQTPKYDNLPNSIHSGGIDAKISSSNSFGSDDKGWLFFDDERVSSVAESHVWRLLQDGEYQPHGTPYLLFYANAKG